MMTDLDVAAWQGRFGGFARMFPRRTPAELADAMKAAGLTQVQLNLSALGLSTIPESHELDALDLAGIAGVFESRDLRLWGLSATYNMAHPDFSVRRAATNSAAQFIRTIPSGVAYAATLCTGSRDAQNMWRAHPDNATPEAWHDFRAELDLLLEATADNGLLLAVEPEPGNVVSDASAAERLLSELGSDADRVGIILDPANLTSSVERSNHFPVLQHAFATLAAATVCVHVKDTVPWNVSLAGHGVVDYSTVINLVCTLPTAVPLIIQDASENEVPEILARLRAAILDVGC